jgi:hypothetical protein
MIGSFYTAGFCRPAQSITIAGRRHWCLRRSGMTGGAAESGVTWLPYVFDRLDTEYADRGRVLGFKQAASPEHLISARNGPLDQLVRVEFAAPRNNLTGIADQRERHSPQGGKTTE